jgi:hypothetical protein
MNYLLLYNYTTCLILWFSYIQWEIIFIHWSLRAIQLQYTDHEKSKSWKKYWSGYISLALLLVKTVWKTVVLDWLSKKMYLIFLFSFPLKYLIVDYVKNWKFEFCSGSAGRCSCLGGDTSHMGPEDSPTFTLAEVSHKKVHQNVFITFCKLSQEEFKYWND